MGLGWLLGLAACGSGNVFVNPPADAASVLVVRGAGAKLEIEAYAVDSVPPLAAADEARLLLLLYDEALSDLRLASGPLKQATELSCASRKLPAPQTVLEAQRSGGEPRELSELPQDLQRFEYEVPCPCVRWEERSFEGDGGAVLDVLVPDGMAPLFVQTGGVYAWGDTLSPPSHVDTGTVAVLAGCARGEEVYLASRDLIWRYDGGSLRRETTPLPSLASIEHIDCSDGEHPLELLALDDEGRLFSWGDSAWSTVWSESAFGNSGVNPQVEWLAPGESLFSQNDGLGLYSVRSNMEPVLEPWSPLDPRGAIKRFRYAPGFGLLINTRGNFVLQSQRLHIEAGQRRDWEELAGHGSVGLDELLPYGSGFLLIGDRGRVLQYTPDTGFCPVHHVNPAQQLRRARSLTDGTLFIGSDQGTLTVLTPEPWSG